MWIQYSDTMNFFRGEWRRVVRRPEFSAIAPCCHRLQSKNDPRLILIQAIPNRLRELLRLEWFGEEIDAFLQ
jgi:hypothetical protein